MKINFLFILLLICMNVVFAGQNNQRNHEYEKAEKVELLLAQGKFDKADSVLLKIENDLSNMKHEVLKTEMAHFLLFKRYISNKMQENGGFIKSLKVADSMELAYMATNFKGKAAIEAQNILCFFTGNCATPDFPLFVDPKSMLQEEDEAYEANTAYFETMSIRPNPNKACFEILTPSNCVVQKLKITNIEGKEMLYELIEKNENVQLIEMQNSIAGLYFVEISCVDGSVFKENMIVIK